MGHSRRHPNPRRFDLLVAQTGDAEGIARLSRDLIETGLPWTWRSARVAKHIHSPEALVLVARGSSAHSPASDPAGFAIMYFSHDAAHLMLLAVKPRYRRLGLGTRLMRWLERSADTAGLVSIGLEVRSTNLEARRFYEGLGYETQEKLPRYYSGREDGVRMRRILRADERLMLKLFGDSPVLTWNEGG